MAGKAMVYRILDCIAILSAACADGLADRAYPICFPICAGILIGVDIYTLRWQRIKEREQQQHKRELDACIEDGADVDPELYRMLTGCKHPKRRRSRNTKKG